MGKRTKHQMVKEEIQQRIETGEYQIGEKIPAESQLMETYSVSRHTIRQAIASLVNEGVLEKVQGSGTFVRESVQKAQPQTNKTIGVITTYLSDYIFPSIIRGIEEELREKGYSLLLASTQNNPIHEQKSLEMMLQHKVDGFIVEPTRSSYLNPNLSYYLQFKREGIPFVYLHSSYPEMEAPVVAMDDVKAAELATQHLIDQGHRRIAVITKADDAQGRSRLKGFIQTMEKEDLPLTHQHILTYETETQDTLTEEIVALLRQPKRPTAIVAYNDQIALFVEEAAREVGLSIPTELALVSHDASGLRLNGNGKALTSVRHPKEQMGRDAAQLLLTAIQSPAGKIQSIFYEPELLIQDTSKASLSK
ncbi:GntR family transcriptional regulator [Jeotgalibaca caeni]|uniref:GntR family transcriptional regulator n=1 Tax=Jeotgalibaca caeni TaxID=3028623 RepID=UPI00237E5EC6|nr:GntR family transcriptional regulator [Jeotgalibaca caeni]MDE1549576.1 GntR family transcriptional regulator [Jeotgalibaca caeni]